MGNVAVNEISWKIFLLRPTQNGPLLFYVSIIQQLKYKIDWQSHAGFEAGELLCEGGMKTHDSGLRCHGSLATDVHTMF